MKQLFAFAGSLAITALMSGCVTCTGRPCASPELPVRSLESEYGCPDTRRQLNVNLSQTHTVIRSQADFDRLVTSSCQPRIDFNAYDLVIGKKELPSGNSGIMYTLRRDCKTNQVLLRARHKQCTPTCCLYCETNQVLLRVVFQQNLTAEAPSITYHALVPKLAPGEDVRVKIEVKQGRF